MREWEYRKIALNQLSPRTADVDVLNDAGDGETWSGRGRMATWLKRKQESGEHIVDYLV